MGVGVLLNTLELLKECSDTSAFFFDIFIVISEQITDTSLESNATGTFVSKVSRLMLIYFKPVPVGQPKTN